jgi:hypothetical protein
VTSYRDDLLRAAGADWAGDPELPADYQQQLPNTDRVVSQAATRGGRRVKRRYHGTTKNSAWLKRRLAALNLRTLLGRGLARLNRHDADPRRPGCGLQAACDRTRLARHQGAAMSE